MCYHISFDETIESIYAYIPELKDNVKLDSGFQAMYLEPGFIFPKHPVVLLEDGQLKLKLFEWGMIAEYMKGTTVNGQDRKRIDVQRMKLLNARAERIVQDHKSVWYRKRHQRLLIPVTGFFEYREVKGFKTKVPYFIRLKTRKMFFLPGLYNYSHIPNMDGELIGTFTLIIRAANSVMMQIHNSGDHSYRMPLMLNEELERMWIEDDLTDEEIQAVLDFEMPSDQLEYWPVKSLYRADPYDAELIQPKEYEALKPITG